MYDLFGLPTGSPLSCDGWRHMIDSEDRAFLEAFLEGAARSGEAFQMEIRVMTPGGIRRQPDGGSAPALPRAHAAAARA